MARWQKCSNNYQNWRKNSKSIAKPQKKQQNFANSFKNKGKTEKHIERWEGVCWTNRVEENLPYSSKYLISIAFALSLFTPAAAEVQPTNGLERLFQVIFLLLGLGMITSLFGTIASLMTIVRQKNAEVAYQKELLEKFFGERLFSKICFFCIFSSAFSTFWKINNNFSFFPQFFILKMWQQSNIFQKRQTVRQKM